MLAKDRLEDWKKWYFEHKNTNMPIEKRIEFLQKNIEGLFELMDAVIQTEAGHRSSIIHNGRSLNYVS